MPKTKAVSPARSQGGITTPKRKTTRGSRSLCSPALSTASGRLTSLIDQFKDKNMDSFALSPLNGRSVLNDNTEIDEPRRKSWWKKLDENSQDVMEVLEDNKLTVNNPIEEFIDVDVLSQEKKNYTLDLPESSDNESIHSIVLPQRRLFTQKENLPQKNYGHLMDNRESLAKLHKTNNTHIDKTLNVGTRELFQNTKRSKPIFPAALLNISPDKTAADKTRGNELPDPKPQVRNIFGNRPANKRKNMFADFIVSESEDEIPDIQPKVFGFQKKLEQRRISSVSRGRESSPASSITTDIEMDFRMMLPSSTMVENQLEDMVDSTPVKRARLSKLSEAKESEAGTLQTNTSSDKTKQSNKSASSKNKSKASPDIKDRSFNSSRTTRSMLKNASKHEENVNTSLKKDAKGDKSKSKITSRLELDVSPSKSDTDKQSDTLKSKSKITSRLNELDVSPSKSNTDKQSDTLKSKSKITSRLNELDVSPSKTDTDKQSNTLHKSQNQNKSKTRNSLKTMETEIEEENCVANAANAINNATRVINKSRNKSLPNTTNKSVNEKERTVTIKVHDKVDKTLTNDDEQNEEEDDENNFTLEYEQDDEVLDEADVPSNNHNDNTKKHNTIVLEKDSQQAEINKSKSNKSSLANKTIQKPTKTVEESVESQTEQYSADDYADGNQEPETDAAVQDQEDKDEEMVDQEMDNEANNSREDMNNETEQENEDEMNVSQENEEEANESEDDHDEVNISQVANESQEVKNENEEDEDQANESQQVKNKENGNEEHEDQANESQEVENKDNENEEDEDQANESQEVENKENENEEDEDQANESQEVENKENENEEDEDQANESQEVEAEVNESQKIEEDEQNENQEVENEEEDNESEKEKDEANVSQEVANESHEAENEEEIESEKEEDEANESHEAENESEKEEDEANESHEAENEEENESEDDNDEGNQSQEVGTEVNVSQEAANESQEVENKENESEEDEGQPNESQEIEAEVNESQEIEEDEANESQEIEEEANESQIDEDDEAPDQDEQMDEEEEEEANDSQVNDASVNESQEIEDDQQMEDSDEADKAIATDAEISDQDDNQTDEMEVDDDDEESENEETEQNEQVSHEERQIEEQNEIEPSEEVVEESPNVTHDTTGRHRKKNLNKSPEVILHNKTNQMDSFTAQGRNTSVRTTKSMIKNLNIKPSLAPPRDSIGFSDGTTNSSAEGSGWDSHRTTRKTLRQTFGKDFTPRKSLRALVMEKSAKRQTEHMEMHSETVKFPLANSTEMPEDSNHDVEDVVESDHEMSRRTRQTTLEQYLQKIKEQNIEKKLKMEAAIRNSLKAPVTNSLSLFKVPGKPAPRRPKPSQSKPKKQIKSVIPLDELPPEVIEDMKYKPPKRFQPTNASWITKRLYKFLETKLEPKYDYKARVRAEKLVETIYSFAKDLRRHHVAPADAVDVLKHELARLDVVRTHFDFYEFFHEFMPREVRIKVVPDIVNKIALPRHGVFSDILRGNTVHG